MAVSYKFSSLKYNVKGIYIFHLILVGILSILVLPVKSSEGEGELEGGYGAIFAHRKKMLSVMRVRC